MPGSRANSLPGMCARCGKPVPAGEGRFVGPGKMIHQAPCRPPASRRAVTKRILRIARDFLAPAVLATVTVIGCSIAIAGDPSVPDDGLSPGVVASTDQAEVCGIQGGQTYSKRHRLTTSAMKQSVAHEYGQTHCGEIDHRVELSLGGADDIKNLWCQPGPPAVWNYKLKDRLEAEVWRRVCKRHTMSLAEGQAVFLGDWRKGYCQIIGGAPCEQ